MPDLAEQNKLLVRRFGEAVNNHELHLLDGLVAPDFERHCQATPFLEVRSLDDFKALLQQDRAAVPDGRTNPRFVVSEGEYVAVYGTYTGTQSGQWGPLPPSGKRLELEVGGVFRVADGKIAEMWITWDNLAALAQIGQWPPAAGMGSRSEPV